MVICLMAALIGAIAGKPVAVAVAAPARGLGMGDAL